MGYYGGDIFIKKYGKYFFIKEDDLDNLERILVNTGFKKPSLKISIYKNRRGRWKGIYLWCNSQRGICHFDPVFASKWTYELIDMEDLKIRIQDASAF